MLVQEAVAEGRECASFQPFDEQIMRIPIELTEYKQWVLWRRTEVNGRQTKIPISPWTGKTASSDKPATWSSYRHARYACHRHKCDGVGFVFTAVDPFCGIDLDQCRSDDGTIAPSAMEWIKRFRSYAELSPSGDGVHVVIKAKLPGKGRRSGKIEVYDCGRYFTMTGDHIPDTPFAIHDGQCPLEQLSLELFSSPAPEVTARYLTDRTPLSDDELIVRAASARNGDRFKRLWAGETSDYENDHSRADLALCRILAFWCGGDADRIDRLFRRSGLMREKWNRRTGDCSYGSLTIKSILR
jgi:primase-polymerase (primpol)-like protein